jgi:NADH-quinone oxidoreductase subunit G
MTAPTAAPTDLVTLTIDGHEVKVPKGTLVVEAAKQVGIEIPVFCYHPKLKPVGACRMCLVEIEKMPRLQTACTSPVAEGMVITTNNPNVIAAQNGVLELMLANHPLDCPICDKGGECPLQDNTFKFGLGVSRFTEEKRRLDKALPLSDRIVLDRERCIMCFRCTRFQAEIPGDEALTAVDRGGYSEIGVLEGETFDSPFSGNTIELCPVGALTSRQYRFRARPWELQRTPSTCAGCAVGCNLEIHSRDGRVLRLVSRENPEVDGGWLCDYGRFDTRPPIAEQRVAQPLARRGGALEPVTGDAAFARAVDVLRSGSVGLAASPNLTNEAIWLFADALRAVLPSATAGFWPVVEGRWPLEGAIKDLPSSKTVVLVGLDPWIELPILALWLRRAVQAGGTLVSIGPENGLFRDTAHWLRVPAGREIEIVRGLLAEVDRSGSGTQVGEEAAVTGRAARAGREPDAEALAAAARGLGQGPSTLLVHPRILADSSARADLDRLAELLGRNGGMVMVGSPALAANGRAALELGADLSSADVSEHLAGLDAVLLVGRERWPDTGRARRVLVTTEPVEEDESVDVVLPMAHPYEQAGSLTNLEGRVQLLTAGALPPRGVAPDWTILADLAARLGGSPPTDLQSIRAALAEAHPKYRFPEGAAGPRGKIALPLA